MSKWLEGRVIGQTRWTERLLSLQVAAPLASFEAGQFTKLALDLDGDRVRLFWVRVDERGERCVRRRTQTLEVAAEPGMWDLIVEVPERAARQGRMLILITRDPP